jgi:dTDP-4-amino-4,6-dideoxygalactose transaminase
MQVPLVDLKQQYQSIKNEMDSAILKFIATGWFVGGPALANFESNFATSHNARFCVGVNSGTSALHASLWALDVGIGDEVIVPVNTFIATAEAVTLTGAKPIFIDHDESYNLDLDKIKQTLEGNGKLGSSVDNIKAVIPVHLYGLPCRVEKVLKIAEKYDLSIVEDCSQAHLAYSIGGKTGKKFVGTTGAMGTFSFYPAKNLGAFGDAGAIITNDEKLAEKMRKFADHGSITKYHHEFPGHNYRMSGIQATILRVKLKYLKKCTAMRREVARLYEEALRNVAEVKTPPKTKNDYHVYHLYVIRAKERDQLQEFLKNRGVSTGLHYPKPLHLQDAYSNLGYKEGDFPKAENYCNEILSLPMFPELKPEQINFVVNSIKEFYRK